MGWMADISRQPKMTVVRFCYSTPRSRVNADKAWIRLQKNNLFEDGEIQGRASTGVLKTLIPTAKPPHRSS